MLCLLCLHTGRVCIICIVFVFFKQKTAYEMRISDWSSDVCSSDLTCAGIIAGVPIRGQSVLVRLELVRLRTPQNPPGIHPAPAIQAPAEIGRASCRERVCQYV